MSHTVDKSKLAGALMHKGNSLLGCFVPHIYQNLDNYDRIKADLAARSPAALKELEEDIEGDDGFLGSFRAEFGAPGLSKDEIFQILRNIKDPANRELLLAPVLRRMLPNILRKRYPAYWDALLGPDLTPEQLLHKVTGRSGDPVLLKEALAFALRFGFKPVVYKDGVNISDAVYADPDLAPALRALPAEAPEIKIIEVAPNAYAVEMATAQLAQAHNAHYAPYAQRQVNQDAALDAFRKKLAETPAGDRGKLDFSAVVASNRPALSGAGFLFNLGQRIFDHFGGVFAKSAFAGGLGMLFAYVMQGFGIVLEFINSYSKQMKPDQDLDADDIRLAKDPAEAALFKNVAAKVEEGDRGAINALWHKAAANKESTKDAWDALIQALDNAGLYKDWEGMLLAPAEKELLDKGFAGMARDPGHALGAEQPQWDPRSGFAGPMHPEGFYRGILQELKNTVEFSSGLDDYKAAVCRYRQDLLNRIKKVQQEVSTGRERIKKLEEMQAAIRVDGAGRRINDNVRLADGSMVTITEAIKREKDAIETSLLNLTRTLMAEQQLMHGMKQNASCLSALEKYKTSWEECGEAFREKSRLEEELKRAKDAAEVKVAKEKFEEAYQIYLSAEKEWKKDYGALQGLGIAPAPGHGGKEIADQIAGYKAWIAANEAQPAGYVGKLMQRDKDNLDLGRRLGVLKDEEEFRKARHAAGHPSARHFLPSGGPGGGSGGFPGMDPGAALGRGGRPSPG